MSDVTILVRRLLETFIRDARVKHCVKKVINELIGMFKDVIDHIRVAQA